MKNECSIVEDLLPLYVEEMVSGETAAFVAEHLEHCSACRGEFEKLRHHASMEQEKTEHVQEALPLKTVKRKFRKRRLIMVLLVALVTAAVLCVGYMLWPASVDYGQSEMYTRADMNGAIRVIKEKFYTWDGCKLYSISYTSDDVCREELAYVNDLRGDGDPVFTECIVFRTCFRSPLMGGGGWNDNFVYDWGWYLGREAGGEWQLLTWGAP